MVSECLTGVLRGPPLVPVRVNRLPALNAPMVLAVGTLQVHALVSQVLQVRVDDMAPWAVYWGYWLL